MSKTQVNWLHQGDCTLRMACEKINTNVECGKTISHINNAYDIPRITIHHEISQSKFILFFILFK